MAKKQEPVKLETAEQIDEIDESAQQVEDNASDEAEEMPKIEAKPEAPKVGLLKPKDGHVHVKFLKYVGQYTPGDIAEVSEEHAQHLCAQTQMNDGNGLITHQKAILLSVAQQMDAAPINLKNLTLDELRALGKKNITKSPNYADIDRKLKHEAAAAKKNAEKSASK